jgi:acyl-CoA synthetase (AMP-forming)/AMP-acid ligase II
VRQLVVHAPGEVVAVGEGPPRTAGDLAADAGRLAAHLSGLPAGEVVLVCADRYRFAAGLLGAWAARHAVRIPPNGQPEAVRAAAEGPAVRALLHDRDGAPGGTDVRPLLAGPAPAGPLLLPPLERCRVLLTTSGSTGAQQTWEKDARRLVDEVVSVCGVFGVARGAVVLATVPQLHIYGLLYGLLAPLAVGAAMVRSSPLHAEEIVAQLERHRAGVLVTVPAHLAALAAADRAPALDVALSAGAPLPPAMAQALRERHGWRVLELYGSTETGAIGWREAREGELWTSFPGIAVGEASDGALLLDSPSVGEGLPRPFPLADRVEVRPDGRFVLHGRMDDVVKVAGKRVGLREVEERLLSLPGVRDAAALARPVAGVRGAELWVAAVAPGWTPERLREALGRWFEPVTLPRRIRLVEALPREQTGKLRRERLLALLEAPAPPAPRLHLEPEAEEALPAPEGREARRLTFTVAPDLRWFEGHFPDHPMLAGVAQLDGLVVRQVERLWPAAGAPRRLKRLKFARPILPGDRITVRLERDAAQGTVAFSIDGAIGCCTSGTLHLGPEAP